MDKQKEMKKEMGKMMHQLTGADANVKSYQDRINQTPSEENAEWVSMFGLKGERGTCLCYPKDEERKKLLSKYGASFIKYGRDGEPDFSPFAEMTIFVSDMSASRQHNFASANEKVLKTKWAKDRGLRTKTDVNNYMSVHHYTYHECSDGVRILMIPTEINGSFGHSGGVAELGALDSEMSEDVFRNIGRGIGTTKIYTRKAVVKTVETIGEAGEDVVNTATEMYEFHVEMQSNYYEAKQLRHEAKELRKGNPSKEDIALAKKKERMAQKKLKAINNELKPIIAAEDMARKAISTTGKDLKESLERKTDVIVAKLYMEGSNAASAVANGDMTVEEACITTAVNVGTYGTKQILVDCAIEKVKENAALLLKDAAPELLSTLSSVGYGIGQIYETASLITGTVMKYVDDDISSEELGVAVSKIYVMKLASEIGGIAGQYMIPIPVVGKIVGSLVSCIVTSAICYLYEDFTEALMGPQHQLDEYKRKVDKLIRDAQRELEEQERQLHEYILPLIEKEEEDIKNGFSLLIHAIYDSNVEVAVEGLNSIISQFSEKVAFSNMDEFDEFFFDDTAEFNLGGK